MLLDRLFLKILSRNTFWAACKAARCHFSQLLSLRGITFHQSPVLFSLFLTPLFTQTPTRHQHRGCTRLPPPNSLRRVFSVCFFFFHVDLFFFFFFRPPSEYFPMPPRRRHDPDVWAPPPPLPNTSSTAAAAGLSTTTTTTTASSAFQRRFANRTEVVGKNGGNAQLGVKATAPPAPSPSPSSTAADKNEKRTPSVKRTAAPAAAARAGVQITAPGESTGGAKARGGDAAAPSQARITTPVKESASQAVVLPTIKPKQHPTNTTSSTPVVVEVDMGSSGSEEGFATASAQQQHAAPRPSLSRRSSSLTVATPDTKVRCLLAPSALAAASDRKQRLSGAAYPLTPPPRSPPSKLAQQQPPSSINSTALSCPPRTPPPVPQQQQSGVRSPSPLFSEPARTAAKASELGVDGGRTRGGEVRTRAAAASKTPMSAPSPCLPAVTRGPSRRSPASADPHPNAAAPPSPQHPGFKPYTLSSYKALMADAAAQKSGGLGPSDTDAQRAAREKRERATAYARRAERIARQSLTGGGEGEADEGAEEENGGDGSAPEKEAGRRAERSRRRVADDGDSDASSTTSRSSSYSSSYTSSASSFGGSSSENHNSHRHRQHSSSPPPAQAASPPSSSGNMQSPHAAQEKKPAQRRRRSIAESSAPVPSPPGPAFAVAAASRKAAKQARVRRERALAYAQKIAQERQQEQLLKAAAAAASAAASRGSAVDGTDEDEAAYMEDTRVGTSAVAAEDRARRQRLLDLEAAHAQKQAAVNQIRGQLRGVAVKGGEGRGR